MALGWFEHLAARRAVGLTGGSEPAADLEAADVVVTRGCGDACPYVPGARYEDGPLDDPDGLDIDAVRPSRDRIRQRVERLPADL